MLTGHPIILYGSMYTNYTTRIDEVNSYTQLEDKSILSKGSEVIIPSSGESAQDISRASVVNIPNVILGGDLNIITLKGSLEPEFLALNITNGASKKKIMRLAQGKSVVHIRNNDLKNVPVFHPSKNEQSRISDFIISIEKNITLHQRKLENIKELKLSYLQRLIPKKGNNESLSKFTQFPNSWTKVKLKECFKERKERSGEGELLAVTINSGVLKADSLDRKDNSSKDKSNYKVVKIGDIAYNSMRMWQGASGLSEFEGIVSPAYTVLIPNESKVDALFISYLFKTENMIQKFQANSQGLTSDTWNLKFPMLKNISIILPPLNEQKHIGKFLEQVDKNISIYENKINKLLDIKKSYLSKMFV